MSTQTLNVKKLATAPGEETQEGTFTGIASPFDGKADRQGDIIQKGAFQASLAARAAEGQPVAMLWCHNTAQPIGSWLSIVETEAGLQVKGRLNLRTEKGREAYELLKDGQLSLSIGYRTKASNPTATGTELTEVDLFEISLVTIPANPSAKVTSYKSFDVYAPDGKKNLERALREAVPELSRRQTKALLAVGFRGIQRDAEPELTNDQVNLIVDRLKQNAELLRK